MAVQRLLVQHVIRRTDHGDGVSPRRGGVPRQLDGVRGRLRTAVHSHLEPPAGRSDEQLRGAPSLLDREQDSLPSRPQREDPVETAADEEVDVGRERVRVQRGAAILERRDRSSE